MVLNLTRYPNSLILMSQYITGEQNLPANFNKTIILRSYYQVTFKLPLSSNPIFKKKIILFLKFKKLLKTIFQKTKLLSSSLRTVVVKLVYSATRFAYQLAPRYFSHLAAKLFFTFFKTSPVSVPKSCQACTVIGPRYSHSMAF